MNECRLEAGQIHIPGRCASLLSGVSVGSCTAGVSAPGGLSGLHMHILL